MTTALSPAAPNESPVSRYLPSSVVTSARGVLAGPAPDLFVSAEWLSNMIKRHSSSCTVNCQGQTESGATSTSGFKVIDFFYGLLSQMLYKLMRFPGI